MNSHVSLFQRTLGGAACLLLLAAPAVSNAADVTLPTIPSGFQTVYRLKPHTAATATQVQSLLQLAGLASPSPNLGATVGVAANLNWRFGTEQYVVNPLKPTNCFSLDQANGALSYSRDLSPYEKDFSPALPSDREALSIANKFLTDNNMMPTLAQGVESMIPTQVQLVRAARPPLKGRPVTGNGQVVSFDKLKIVTYRREINGLPVIGPGSKIVVTIGDKGTVEGVIRRWRPFNLPAAQTTTQPTTSTVATIPPATALAGMKSRLQRKFPTIDQKLTDQMVTNMSVGYYDGNTSVIQPVYLFRLNLAVDTPGEFGPGTDHAEDYLTLAPYLKTAPEAIYQFGDLPNNTAPRSSDID